VLKNGPKERTSPDCI